jgi:hypothetical protein
MRLATFWLAIADHRCRPYVKAPAASATTAMSGIGRHGWAETASAPPSRSITPRDTADARAASPRNTTSITACGTSGTRYRRPAAMSSEPSAAP